MPNVTMDSKMISKGLEAFNNATRLAANITTPKSEERKTNQSYREGDKLDQPHNQTVEVKVGSEQQTKPVIVHEKKETHVHKPYPDGRELSEKECDVERLRISSAHEEVMAELEFRRWQAEQDRKDRKEREERARRDRETREARDKKFGRRLLIGSGICAAIGLGLYAYDRYTYSRRVGSSRLAIPAPKAELSIGVEAEGSVE